jgi:hypothetical protein
MPSWLCHFLNHAVLLRAILHDVVFRLWPVGYTRKVGRSQITTEAWNGEFVTGVPGLGESEGYHCPDMATTPSLPSVPLESVTIGGFALLLCREGEMADGQTLASCPLCAGNLSQARSSLRALCTYVPWLPNSQQADVVGSCIGGVVVLWSPHFFYNPWNRTDCLIC